MAAIQYATNVSNVFGILPFVSEQISCGVSIVKYTDEDKDIIEILDLGNTKSHRISLKTYIESGEYRIATRFRNERMK